MSEKIIRGNKSYIKALLLTVSVILSHSSFGQNVKIGATNAAPNAASMLDVDGVTGVGAAYKGMLVPRMTFAQRTSLAVLAAVAQGLLVYQTDVSGTSLQGFYYNTSLTTTPNWVYIDGTAWDITGNANVTAANNFIGTTVAQDFVVKTGGAAASNERIRVLSGGNIVVNNTGIGGNTDDVFSVYASGTTNGTTGSINNLGLSAINGYSSGLGQGIYGENTGAGNGIYGNATAASGGGTGVFGQTAGDQGIAVAGLSTTVSNAFTPAGVYGAVVSSTGLGVAGSNGGNSGTGVAGIGNALPTFQTLNTGSGGAFAGTVTGVYGFATTWTGAAESAGGYFVTNAATNSFAYVGAKDAAGLLWKVQGNGSNGTIVTDLTGNRVALVSPEAPENLFMDFGNGTLVNGSTHISIDSNLAINIAVSETHPLRVVITPQGNCNQLYYINATNFGFDVMESNSGTSNIRFTWMIIANRADEQYSDGSVSRYSTQRFAPAMKPRASSDVQITKGAVKKD